MDDAALLLAWRNDAETRANSFQTAPVSSETHIEWLHTHLADRSRCRIWIAELDGDAIGQVRVDRLGDDVGEISVSIAAASRGMGIGTRVIDAGTSRAIDELGLVRVEARIKPENRPSVAAFERAGFVNDQGEGEALVLSRTR